MYIYATIFVMLTTSLGWAAPIPATSSSSFIKAEEGFFRSPLGFKIHAQNTDWIHSEAPEENKHIATIYKAPQLSNGVQPALTVRVDPLSEDLKLTTYMNRWLKEYPRLGFKILKSKKVKIDDKMGFLIDLVHEDKKKQLRQVVFVKKQNAIILTCRDQAASFRETVKDCNQIIRNFSWLN